MLASKLLSVSEADFIGTEDGFSGPAERGRGTRGDLRFTPGHSGP